MMKKFDFKHPVSWIFLLILVFQPRVDAQVVRKPYLQVPTPGSVVVCWISGTGVPGEVYYGTDPDSLDRYIRESEFEEIYHEVRIEGLESGVKYYYTVDGTTWGIPEQYFIANPLPGSSRPVRIWVIADFGQTNSDQNDVRLETVARWKEFNGDCYHADMILSLGDQTEDDSRYQLQHNYFIQLEPVLLNTPLFTAAGNHDNHDGMQNYLSTFVLPTEAEAGGIPSGTEKYYSLDYGNIHVVVLNTEFEDSIEMTEQVRWLERDLENNRQDWLIACMHRPFHSGGHHRTNDEADPQERRDTWLPLLEGHGVDLILQGHNHVYERSFMLDNLTGKTTALTEANVIDRGLGRVDEGGPYRKKKHVPHAGTVFVEVPGGGVASKDFELYQIFPVHYNGYEYEGSLVVDVNSNRMDVTFLCNEPDAEGSHVRDHFTLIKE